MHNAHPIPIDERGSLLADVIASFGKADLLQPEARRRAVEQPKQAEVLILGRVRRAA